ncbi:MAG: haloalkane dehalogenase [Betaproteobacteria bacterium]|jgi:haloalkane dehalogenase|nr:haloalkane dehalogenase [Betaproteobacteria bacterium]
MSGSDYPRSAAMPAMRYAKRHATVLGKRMAYVEAGEGDPIVFLHGNVTSSFMWRNIIPHLEDIGRCIAIDNIGQGDSEKLRPSGPGSYRLAEHQRYIDGLLAALGVDRNVTFVVHDWGSQLGFTWAYHHPDAVKGIAYLQALVGNFGWDQWPPEVQALFRRFRSTEGEELVLQQNFFVERILPAMVMRKLTEAELEEYRRPFRNPGEDRRPTLTWPRELPIEGEPADVLEIIERNSAWLGTTQIPKLFVNAEPGAVLVGRHREICRGWPNQTEVTVRGLHYVHEDSPDEIGAAIRNWYVAHLR